jgi:hypothetical protein
MSEWLNVVSTRGRVHCGRPWFGMRWTIPFAGRTACGLNVSVSDGWSQTGQVEIQCRNCLRRVAKEREGG